MFHSDTNSAPLWEKITTDPIFNHWSAGLITEAHRQDLITTSLNDFHASLPEPVQPQNETQSPGGLILPDSDFESLISGNMAIRKRGKMFKKTLKALYRDMLDRDATHLFWRMYYCHRKGPVMVDGKPEMKRWKECRSMFCPSCRDKRQKERSKLALDLFGDRPHDRLHALTILYQCPTNFENIKTLIERFKYEMDQAFQKAGHLLPVQFHGAMELDYKHPSLFEVTTLDGGKAHRAHCKQAFAAIGVDLDSPSCPESWWLVHYHAIVDVGNNDAIAVNQVLHDAFKGAHRVRMTPLHDENRTPKLDSIENLSNYQLKSKLQYGENIYAGDPTRPNRTCYGAEYEPHIIAQLCKAFDEYKNINLIKFDHGSRGSGM